MYVLAFLLTLFFKLPMIMVPMSSDQNCYLKNALDTENLFQMNRVAYLSGWVDRKHSEVEGNEIASDFAHMISAQPFPHPGSFYGILKAAIRSRINEWL